jgi:hypothetical protein
MTYSPASFDTFGLGLNLRDKVDAVRMGEAIDALNVEFSERGAIGQRDGYAAFTESTLTNRVQSLHVHTRAGGTPQLLAGCGTRLEALDSDGAVASSQTGLTDGIWDFARFGTPNSEMSYAGQGLSTLKRWDGSAWTSVASTPKAGALAVMATSNRLVAGRFLSTTGGPTGGAGTSSPSHVYFSNAGLSETWSTNDFLQLTPGDGEAVQAVIEWRELVFIFKESKFFVVYGESVDAGGDPIFDYRPVDTGVGLASPRAVCVSEQGVFFMDHTGVYVTSGGEPTKVSSAIDPIFKGGASSFYLGGDLDQPDVTNCAMTHHDNRLYLSFPTDSANDRTLVFDPLQDWWSLWDIPASCLISSHSSTAFSPSSTPELFFGYASGDNHIGRLSSAYTNDDGEAITSRWRSGWFDYDNPVVKTIRESKMWGSGIVGFAVSRDFKQPTGTLSVLDFTDTTASVWGGSTWGGGTWANPAGLIPRLRRYAIRGTVFSTYLENTTLDQTFSVHRLDHHLREQRVPSVRQGVPA